MFRKLFMKQDNNFQNIIQREEVLISDLVQLLNLSPHKADSLREHVALFSDAIRSLQIMSINDIDGFIDWLFLSDFYTISFSQYERLGMIICSTCKVYVPNSVRARIDDYADLNSRAADAGFLLSCCKSSPSIELWNCELSHFVEGLFDYEDHDSVSILERIVEIAEEARDENMSFPEYLSLLADLPFKREQDIIDNTCNQVEHLLRFFAEDIGIKTESPPQDERKRFARLIYCGKRLKTVREHHYFSLLTEEINEVKSFALDNH